MLGATMEDDSRTQAPALRSVLFVDFDNVYLGLRALDDAAAQTFAAHPERWVAWLERGDEPNGGVRRRFLMKSVYLNPTAFGEQRAMFTRSGFRVIDCPSLTTRGKNSADIYMVLDVVDALQRDVVYEDFVLVSADADFTPILHRVRSLDRRTTVVTGSNAAAAYRAVADVFVTAEDLASAAVNGGAAAAGAGVAETGAEAPGPESDVDLVGVVARMLEVVNASEKPVPTATVAQAGLDLEPRLKDLEWLGCGSFRGFAERHLTPLAYVATHPPYLLDPARHTEAQIVQQKRERLSPFLEQVCYLTGVPGLSEDAYASLFAALTDELDSAEFSLGRTAREVRNRTERAGNFVPRASVAFVLTGLTYAGVKLAAGMPAHDLADAWYANVVTLLRNAGRTLTSEEEAELRRWLTGADPGGGA